MSLAAVPSGLRAPKPDLSSYSIIIWNESPVGSSSPARLLAGCGVRIQELAARPPLESLRSVASRAVIVIAIDGGIAASAASLVKQLSGTGFAIVLYVTRAEALSVAGRCGLLLAGCARVTDAAGPAGEHDLRRQVIDTLHAIAERADEQQRLRQAMSHYGFVGRSAAMMSVFDRVARVSRLSDLPTLITGETGTGKELVARALHAQDPKRRQGPFVALNCGALSPGVVESELFGHRRGAFTSADRDRRGLFRAAEGGVLFLDEVGELDAAVQTKLLRVLQENRVRAVGDEDDAPVDVRVLAATNRDLRAMIDRHAFRADLFHRLNVVSVHIPPIRERRDDVAPLAEHFARRHASVNAAASSQIHPDVIEALSTIDLPGNARQLENIVRCALVQNDGRAPIGLCDLPPEVWQQVADRQPAPPAAASRPDEAGGPVPGAAADYTTDLLAANGWSLARSLRSFERSILEVALREAAGNQSHVARRLGITARSVYNMVRRHRLA